MAPAAARLLQGSIYILPDCPPLHGTELKDRPVILVAPQDILDNLQITILPLIVVACSTTPQVPDDQKIRLPDVGSQPQTKTGLKEPTWAVPAWRVAVERHRFAGLARIGFLTRGTLAQVMMGVVRAANVVPLPYPARRR